MAADKVASPFAGQSAGANVSFAPDVQEAENKDNSMQTSKSFKLVASPSGKDLYVEDTKEYDPLAPHRKRDAASNKGEGLGFLFCCFGGGAGAGADGGGAAAAEPAKTAERHYSLPPSESQQSLPTMAK